MVGERNRLKLRSITLSFLTSGFLGGEYDPWAYPWNRPIFFGDHRVRRSLDLLAKNHNLVSVSINLCENSDPHPYSTNLGRDFTSKEEFDLIFVRLFRGWESVGVSKSLTKIRDIRRLTVTRTIREADSDGMTEAVEFAHPAITVMQNIMEYGHGIRVERISST